MYKYLFGPVPSRRLGMSLGVDLVPHKVCSLDCIYCECGPSTKRTINRMEYILFHKVTEELHHFFNHNPDPDYITFSGSGEPTLNSRIGEVLRYIKSIKPGIPVAVLTNGTLFDREEVRRDILTADLILPSLDAATEEAFHKINRPAGGLTVENYINGLVNLRKEYQGKIWLEILFLPGFNDDAENLEALKKAIERIQPDKVQLNTLDRPGVLDDLHPAPVSWLKNVAQEWEMPNVELIAAPVNRKNIKAYRRDTETAILETIYRRPCTAKDLTDILGLHLNEVNKYLDVLDSENKLEVKRRERGLFYQVKK